MRSTEFQTSRLHVAHASARRRQNATILHQSDAADSAAESAFRRPAVHARRLLSALFLSPPPS